MLNGGLFKISLDTDRVLMAIHVEFIDIINRTKYLPQPRLFNAPNEERVEGIM